MCNDRCYLTVSLSNSKNAKVDLVLENDLFSFVMASATLPYFLFTEFVCLSKELPACKNGHYYVFLHDGIESQQHVY
jgi:hypothetical protein